MPKQSLWRNAAIALALCAVLLWAPFGVAGWISGSVEPASGFWDRVHAQLAQELRPLWPLGWLALAAGLVFWARNLPMLHYKGGEIYRIDGARVPMTPYTITSNKRQAAANLRAQGMLLEAKETDDLGVLIERVPEGDGRTVAAVNRTQRTYALNHEWLDGLAEPERWPRNLYVAGVLILTLPGSWIGAGVAAVIAWLTLDGVERGLHPLMIWPSRIQFALALVRDHANATQAP